MSEAYSKHTAEALREWADKIEEGQWEPIVYQSQESGQFGFVVLNMMKPRPAIDISEDDYQIKQDEEILDQMGR